MNRYGLTQLEKLAIAVAVLAVLAIIIPLYRQLVDIKRTADCQSNLKDIATAINLYLLDYGNTLPLAYYANPDGSPQTDSAGRPLTWVVCISSYMKRDLQRALKCPADPTGGSTVITDPRDSSKTLTLSYGFYAPLSAVRLEDLPNPGLSVLIADSLAGGQYGSLNPNPLLGGNDGFALEKQRLKWVMPYHAGAVRYFKERTAIPQWYQVHRGTADVMVDGVRLLPFTRLCEEIGIP